MIDLNAEFITIPLVFATSAANKQYCDKHSNYIYLWNSPADQLPVYLIRDTKKMEHHLIVRMQNTIDFKSDSIETDVMNEIKKIMYESD